MSVLIRICRNSASLRGFAEKANPRERPAVMHNFQMSTKSKTQSFPCQYQVDQTDFDSLRLRSSESQLLIIRNRIGKLTSKVRRTVRTADIQRRASKIAQIVSSAYRILDPRRRKNRLERLNLSPWLDRDSLQDLGMTETLVAASLASLVNCPSGIQTAAIRRFQNDRRFSTRSVAKISV